jgi:hypothetical protein
METLLVLVSVFIAIGLIGMVATEVISISHQAEAKGCRTGVAVNASQGRCIQF